MKANKQLAVLAVALSAVSGSALAAGNDSGFYLGGGVGYSNHAGDCPNDSDCTRSATGFKAFGGYQFNPYLGLEFGYMDLGKAKSTTSVSEKTVATNSFTTAVLGMVPLGTQASLFGKVGLHWSKTKYRYSDKWNGHDAADETHTGFLAGLGGQYNFTPNLLGRVEWEWLNEGDKVGNYKGDIHLISASVIYKF